LLGVTPGLTNGLHQLDAFSFALAHVVWGGTVGGLHRVWALGPLERLIASDSRPADQPDAATASAEEPTPTLTPDDEPSPGLADGPTGAADSDTVEQMPPDEAEPASPTPEADPSPSPIDEKRRAATPEPDVVSPSAGAAFKRLTGAEPTVSGMQQRLGAKLERLSKGKARVYAETDALADAQGLVPGSLVLALAEIAASHAARSTLDAGAEVLFVDRTFGYPEPVEPVGLEAKATVIGRGGFELFVEVPVEARGGSEIARAEFRAIVDPSSL